MVKVLIYLPKEISHSSYIHTGLLELEKKGLIECDLLMKFRKEIGRFSVLNGTNSLLNVSQPKTSFYKLIDMKNNMQLTFAIDSYDIPYYFSVVALEKCDYVFKRNYSQKYISKLPKKYRKKIYPLGIPFKVNRPKCWESTITEFGTMILNLSHNFKLDSQFFERLSNIIQKNKLEYEELKKTPTLKHFDEFNSMTDNKILYQKRFFPEEITHDIKIVHQQRFSFVKGLMESFGEKKYIGGLVPCDITKEKYPGYITNLPVDQRQYVNIMKKTRIVIYTRGLSNSIGWTLPEYLAAGKVILAEKFDTVLPNDLIDGKHLLFFDNVKDCIEKAKILIKDEKKCAMLSKNARSYYEKYVHPIPNTKRILEFMLKKKLGSIQ